ncbi:MAG: roadblock/LC7 domain-containing protein [Candidatus Helarchaeota archaeon]
MAKKEDIEPQLAQLMDSVPEVEGIAAVDRVKKKVIVAQTITDMDHDSIAKNVIATVENASKLGDSIEKGKVTELSLKANEGYCVIVASDKLILIVLTGSDAASSVGLILRNLRVILEKL